MADIVSIDGLTAAGALTGTERIPLSQGAPGARVTRGALLSAIVAYIRSLLSPPVPQIGWTTPALGIGEQFQVVAIPAAGWTFPANFSQNTGLLIGVAPSSDFVIRIRHYLATGADNGELGTITIKPDKTIVRATTGGTQKVLAGGGSLMFTGPATAQNLTNFAERMVPSA